MLRKKLARKKSSKKKHLPAGKQSRAAPSIRRKKSPRAKRSPAGSSAQIHQGTAPLAGEPEFLINDGSEHEDLSDYGGES
jgi:hypothetical protein